MGTSAIVLTGFVVLSTFISGATYSVIAPSLPPDYEKKGVDTTVVGFIFAAFSLAEIIVSPFIGNCIEDKGPLFFMVGGLIIIACCFFGFGLIDRVIDPFVITYLALILRIL